MTSHRQDLLEEALKITTTERNADYGPPTQDFDRTARFWSILWEHKLKPGEHIDPHEVALAMDLLKTSRLVWSSAKRDSWVDKAGYAACGFECVVSEFDIPQGTSDLNE